MLVACAGADFIDVLVAKRVSFLVVQGGAPSLGSPDCLLVSAPTSLLSAAAVLLLLHAQLQHLLFFRWQLLCITVTVPIILAVI